jgi:hypothetical protein
MEEVLFRVHQFLYALVSVAILEACSSAGAIVSWQEEVKLLDGRTIIVEQKKQCDPGQSGIDEKHCLARESWLTFSLPEFSSAPIVWHQRLFAMVLNVYNNNLYVVAYPRTGLEYEQLGKPIPPYVAFVWRAGQWIKIPIKDVPSEIYDTNLWLDDVLPGSKYLTLARKMGPEMLGDPRVAPFMKRIAPNFNPNVAH